MDIVEQRLAADVQCVDGPVATADLCAYQRQLLLKLRSIRGTRSSAFVRHCYCLFCIRAIRSQRSMVRSGAHQEIHGGRDVMWLWLVDTMQKEESCLEQLRQERDDARRERDALQTQVAKLQYRVHHLKQHVLP